MLGVLTQPAEPLNAQARGQALGVEAAHAGLSVPGARGVGGLIIGFELMHFAQKRMDRKSFSLRMTYQTSSPHGRAATVHQFESGTDAKTDTTQASVKKGGRSLLPKYVTLRLHEALQPTPKV